MPSLGNALQELRKDRNATQLRLEKLNQIISGIESLNGTGATGEATQPIRIISAASRRKMALAQKARWAKVRNGSQPAAAVAKATGATPAKRTMSASSRRKIAATQKARWAKIRAQQKKAA
jgi:phosphopantothenoylcysteine synthetase/decarboxylase